MILVARTAAPAALTANATAWLAALRTAHTEEQKRAAQDNYRRIEIRTALQAMFNSKCAYCESHIAHVTWDHIEHFRPKSRYPSYTFRWTNLFISCPRCNSAEFKGDQFPLKAAGGPIVNPTKENPADHLTFSYDTKTKTAVVGALTPRGTTTIRVLGLNRPALVKVRSDAIRQLLFIKLHETTDAEAAEILKRARDVVSPYLAFIRSLSI